MSERFHLGMTGTREGMTKEQRSKAKEVLRALHNLYDRITLHHGDCVGADEDMHTIFHKRRRAEDKIVIHPPIDNAHRAWCEDHDEMREQKTHFARNRDIVNESSALIVTPMQMEHQSFGGTWYTHDYAKKANKRIYLILPDGTLK